jgi:hypothetical protein
MSQDEGTLIGKISFLTAEQQERVLKFVEDIEAKEPSTEMRILIRFEPFVIWVKAQHPDRPSHSWGYSSGADPVNTLIAYIKKQHQLLVSYFTGEQAIYNIGSVAPQPPERTFLIKGRNLDSGLPSSIELSSVEVREQITSELQHQIKSTALNIKLIPRNMGLPEETLSRATIRVRGRYGHLNGLAEFIAESTGLPIID